MTVDSPLAATRAWSWQRATLVGGLSGGALDLAFAISFATYNGGTPQRLLQTIASGVLGQASYAGGVAAAMLGLGLHFCMSLLLAGGYVLASRRSHLLTRNPFAAGALFGIAVFLLMRFVVLPLSAFPHPITFQPLAWSLDLLSHMLLFGVPIALAARKTTLS